MGSEKHNQSCRICGARLPEGSPPGALCAPCDEALVLDEVDEMMGGGL